MGSMAAIAIPYGASDRASKAKGREDGHAKPPRNSQAISGRSAGGDAAALDARHADRRRAATAVVVSRRRRRASQHRRGRPCRRAKSGNCAAAKRRMSRSTCAMPSSNAAASAICASTASRRRRPGTPSPASTKPRDSRFVRLHTNFPHHRDAVCKVLNCKPERDEVQAALMQWDAEEFETAAYAAGGVVAMMRSHDEWSALPHAQRARRAAADLDRENRRRRAKTVAERAIVRSRACACSICRA